MIESRKPRTLLRRLGSFAAAGLLLAVFLVALALTPWFAGTRRLELPTCNMNLKQIGIALHNYHDEYKTFPPAFVRGPDGRPWHSWRVLILPFLNEEKLFAEYRFDEPWNGPHNWLLSQRRPEVFVCTAAKPNISPNQTTYVAVVGSETLWPNEGATGVNDILDGTSNTILVVEVRDASIPWLAPNDLTFEEACVALSEEAGRRPSSWHTGGVHVLMADGNVRFVNSAINPDIWKALLTRNGGETVPDF